MDTTLLANIKNAVYKVYTPAGTGTAFYVKENDCFITNYHVVSGCRQVALEDNSKYRYKASILLVDPVNDIAVLRCADAPKLSAIAINPSLIAGETETVTVLGFPYGPFSVTEGIISNASRILENKMFIQTDAAINPGNSGGPIVNSQGQLVAIATAKLTEADRTGFGIPHTVLVSTLTKITDAGDAAFGVACPSCGNILKEEASHCPFCGASVDANYFKQKGSEGLAPVIEQAIAAAGIDPVLACTGKMYWEFYQGSSLIRIFVYNTSYIYATSPINSLGGTKLEELYRYLASNVAAPYRYGIYQNNIFLSYRFAVADLYNNQKDIVLSQLTGFLAQADIADNYIEETFGCAKTVFSRA